MVAFLHVGKGFVNCTVCDNQFEFMEYMFLHILVSRPKKKKKFALDSYYFIYFPFFVMFIRFVS